MTYHEEIKEMPEVGDTVKMVDTPLRDVRFPWTGEIVSLTKGPTNWWEKTTLWTAKVVETGTAWCQRPKTHTFTFSL